MKDVNINWNHRLWTQAARLLNISNIIHSLQQLKKFFFQQSERLHLGSNWSGNRTIAVLSATLDLASVGIDVSRKINKKVHSAVKMQLHQKMWQVTVLHGQCCAYIHKELVYTGYGM